MWLSSSLLTKTASAGKTGLFQTAKLENGFLFIKRNPSLIAGILYLLVSVIHSWIFTVFPRQEYMKKDGGSV